MEEYRNWLESVIAEEKIAVQGGADDSKLRACEECLRKVVQLGDNGIDFCNLEAGKKYTAVLKDGLSSNDTIFPVMFVVLDKGHDDKGDYIWYHNITNDSIAFKRYKGFFSSTKYFKAVKE